MDQTVEVFAQAVIGQADPKSGIEAIQNGAILRVDARRDALISQELSISRMVGLSALSFEADWTLPTDCMLMHGRRIATQRAKQFTQIALQRRLAARNKMKQHCHALCPVRSDKFLQ